MSASPWLFLLLLCVSCATSVFQAGAQPDNKGFITIDCGLSEKTGYEHNTTKLWNAPDAAFTDAGTNHIISPEYVVVSMAKMWYSLRSFATGMRNCYTLRSLMPGLKYMIRAKFMYGNYDGLDQPPAFDLHIGVNYWQTVNISRPKAPYLVEAIVIVPDDFVQVCLINTGDGTPIISGLDLRPLKRTLYPHATATQGLVLVDRRNFGPTDANAVVRYPHDPHDRLWWPKFDGITWANISTTEKVENREDDPFEVPTAVMQTAIIPQNASQNIEFSLYPEFTPKDPSPGYIAILHFSGLQRLPSNALQEFYVNVNGEQLSSLSFMPYYLFAVATYNSLPSQSGRSSCSITINATAKSTLPPIINAVEAFSVFPTTNVGTVSQDVSAITKIKAKYQVRKNWVGDPCVPNTMTWDGLTCNYGIASRPPKIISVNLSSGGIGGDISASFADLKAVKYLYLSNNNLTGSIPDALSQLTSLTVLDLSANQLSGSIPSGLLKRVQDGSLILRYGDNPNLCTNGNSCQPAKSTRSSTLAIYIAVPVAVILVIVLVVLLCCFLRRKKSGSVSHSVKPQNEMTMSYAMVNDVCADSSLRLESRRFTYKELQMITNNFQRVLGRGGFGYVYDGFLEDRTQVAVKLQSHSSNQGVKEFLAEAQILSRIHHKNLVSMIGYCKDGEYMALVYEYMSEGTLQEHIEGSNQNGACLAWTQRLRIALESAQGLEYLHKGCYPALIHRDVKATNILLNAKMEARIADFGLSKAFSNENETHVSTNTLVGTPGYVDPEYQATMQPTAKSDVYSFGVVLLELVTGKPAILQEAVPVNIIQWVRQRLARGNIEGVVDERMRGGYDVNGVWKVADIALKCTAQASVQRPTMTHVVAQLQECVELENGRVGGNTNNGFHSGSSDDDPNLSYDAYTTDRSTSVNQNSTTFEMEHNVIRVPTMSTGPAAR
ncbi:putative leucine-rich repeat receptor-like protein kinase [Hordeum vulgare]|nr:putative leucine-rich repeat receptor-like protein kinase [Hordeum vulgare]